MDQGNELDRLQARLNEMQAKLVQSEKMAALGAMAAGVAHELNNPIGFVKNNLIMLQEYLEILLPALRDQMSADKARINKMAGGEDIDSVLDDIGPLMEDTREGVQRVESIVAGLRGFARTDSGKAEFFDLNQCVTDTLKVAANEIKYKARVNQDLQSLPEIFGKPGEINQVILNLLVNAAQAIEEFGEIHIRTQQREEQILLSIADDGVGIEERNLAKLFTPFFTTKPVGKGTGLGLSISLDIVKAHGGRIEVRSQPGQGTEFNVYLPFSQEDSDDVDA